MAFNLNIKKLEEVTMEAMSNWFNEHLDNASKKLFLREIFKLPKRKSATRMVKLVCLPLEQPLVVHTYATVDATTCVLVIFGGGIMLG